MSRLTESRFMAVQSAIRESAQEPVWERWTIDEVDEGIVRVLVSEAADSLALQRIADDILEGVDETTSNRSMRDRLHRAAMAVELVPASEQWSDEGSMFVALRVLAAFLRERVGKPGLPANRPLREGDVFWIILPAGPALDRPPVRGTTLGGGAERVTAYRERQSDVWDVTAAARQVAKREYHRVLEISEDVLDRRQGGPEMGSPGPAVG